MIYFDHAATSYPKPDSVVTAMAEAVTEYGANPGRSGHRLSMKASQQIDRTRILLRDLFQAPSKKNVWFFQNATMALNQGILGFPFQRGDHVVSTAFEHNSVRRPLELLKEEIGLEVTYVEPDEDGLIVTASIEAVCREETKAIIITHGSNVTGAYLSLKEIGEIARDNDAVFIVDASQTAGVLDIQMERDGIHLLAFAGHKGLLGPQGTGALLVSDDFNLKPLVHGGTGSYSELAHQPAQWPDRYESGTLNTPGIAGLYAGASYVLDKGIESIFEHEWKLTHAFLEGLENLERVVVVGPPKELKRLGVVSFHFLDLDSHEVAMILDEHYEIAVRAGLHCAPLAHQSAGTIDTGLIRVSFGLSNTVDEVNTLLSALYDIQRAFA